MACLERKFKRRLHLIGCLLHFVKMMYGLYHLDDEFRTICKISGLFDSKPAGPIHHLNIFYDKNQLSTWRKSSAIEC